MASAHRRRPTLTDTVRTLAASTAAGLLALGLVAVALADVPLAPRLLAVLGAAAVGADLAVGLLRGRTAWWQDAVDSAALVAYGVCLPAPVASLPLLAAVLSLRTLSGSALAAVARAGVYGGVFLAVVVLHPVLPGRGPGPGLDDAVVLAPALALVLVAGLARLLAVALRRGDRAASVERTLLRRGTQLLRLQDQRAIVEHAVGSVIGLGDTDLRSAEPLDVVLLRRHGSVAWVEHSHGPGRPRLVEGDTIPATLLPPRVLFDPDHPTQEVWDDGGGRVPYVDLSPVLHSETPERTGWWALPLGLGREPSWWLLVRARAVTWDRLGGAVCTVGLQATMAMASCRAAAELRFRADHDALTQLPNRSIFAAATDAALRRAQAEPADVAVLFVDLDDFKAVNDDLGHDAGDQLLRQVARRITTLLGPGDVAARVGGDEFAVLLAPAGRPEEAVAVGERIVAALGEPVHVEGSVARVGGTVGVAFGADGDSARELLRHADEAMYVAKTMGKGRVGTYAPEQPAPPVARRGLRRAR